jgi:hypothetical protein
MQVAAPQPWGGVYDIEQKMLPKVEDTSVKDANEPLEAWEGSIQGEATLPLAASPCAVSHHDDRESDAASCVPSNIEAPTAAADPRSVVEQEWAALRALGAPRETASGPCTGECEECLLPRISVAQEMIAQAASSLQAAARYIPVSPPNSHKSLPAGPARTSAAASPLVAWTSGMGSAAKMSPTPAGRLAVCQDEALLPKLLENAAKLSADPTTDLGAPVNLQRLTRLAYYQPVIYCDDSGSMTATDRLSDTRFVRLREIVRGIASVANRLLPEDMGIHLRFINHPTVYNSLTEAQVENVMNGITPDGGTELGTVLESRILQPLLYDVLDRSGGGRLERPLLVCTVTDGCPADGEAFKQAILRCKRRLTSAGCNGREVVFMVSQIGQDEYAANFVRSLREDAEIKDMVWCTSDRLDGNFDEMRTNQRKMEVWLLEMLTKPLMNERA